METEEFQELVLQKLETLVAGQERLEHRMDALEVRMESLETRLDAVETRLGAVETRLDAVETRLGAVETRLDAVETRLDSMERTVHMIKEETGGLMEFQTEAREGFKKLESVVETQSIMLDMLCEHEIEIRKIYKHLA